MFNIKQIDHLVLRVIDIDKMMAFYTKVLMCSVEKSRPDIGLYQLRAGTSLIDLVPVDGPLGAKGGAPPATHGRNMDHFCVQIEPFDAEAIAAHLHKHGVDCGEVQSRYGAQGDGPSLYINDPEANVVELKGPPWPIDPTP
ncbi:MAG: glyoxylase I family protein [Gammaproteobacteria bacterium]|jgi:glyoxylase I family protein